MIGAARRGGQRREEKRRVERGGKISGFYPSKKFLHAKHDREEEEETKHSCCLLFTMCSNGNFECKGLNRNEQMNARGQEKIVRGGKEIQKKKMSEEEVTTRICIIKETLTTALHSSGRSHSLPGRLGVHSMNRAGHVPLTE